MDLLQKPLDLDSGGQVCTVVHLMAESCITFERSGNTHLGPQGAAHGPAHIKHAWGVVPGFVETIHAQLKQSDWSPVHQGASWAIWTNSKHMVWIIRNGKSLLNCSSCGGIDYHMDSSWMPELPAPWLNTVSNGFLSLLETMYLGINTGYHWGVREWLNTLLMVSVFTRYNYLRMSTGYHWGVRDSRSDPDFFLTYRLYFLPGSLCVVSTPTGAN